MLSTDFLQSLLATALMEVGCDGLGEGDLSSVLLSSRSLNHLDVVDEAAGMASVSLFANREDNLKVGVGVSPVEVAVGLVGNGVTAAKCRKGRDMTGVI